MPLYMVLRQNQSCPIPFCDHCGQAITRADAGLYCFSQTVSATPSPVYFVHKRCQDPFEATHPAEHGGLWGSVPLDALPVYMARNLGIDWARAAVVADLMGTL